MKTSQKVKGLQALATSPYKEYVPRFLVLEKLEDLKEKRWGIEGFLPFGFARPCPSKARHGFVDSVPVETPTQLTVGRGHDGATQGRDVVLDLPVTWGIPDNVREKLYKRGGITQAPYFEAVYEDSSLCRLVQMRDGPQTDSISCGATSWVPHETRVKQFLFAGGDALQYEEAAKQAPEGTVVIHSGGSMVSHYSAHAVLNNIPIWFGDPRAIQIGDVLQSTDNVNSGCHPRHVAAGIETGLCFDLEEEDYDAPHFMKPLLAAVHQSVNWLPTEQGAFLVGFSSAVLMRLAYAACFGELRHARTSRGRALGGARHAIYRKALGSLSVFLDLRKKYLNAYKLFCSPHVWKDDAYGGPSWGECFLHTRYLEQTLLRAYRKQDEESVKIVVGALHGVINCAHNGGPFLNKFCGREGDIFDTAAGGSPIFYLEASFKFASLWDKIMEVQAHIHNPVVGATYRANLKKWRASHSSLAKSRKALSDHLVGLIERHQKKHKMTLQFKYRQDGEMIHFQWGSSYKYRSATIPTSLVEASDPEVPLLLEKFTNIEPLGLSFAGSGKEYWILPTPVPYGLFCLLKKNGIVAGGGYPIKRSHRRERNV